MKLYRIYTADVNRDAILNAMGATFAAYTWLPSNGSWHGIPEKSLILEVTGTDEDAPKVRSLAEHIKAMNSQDAVLVTKQTIEETLV